MDIRNQYIHVLERLSSVKGIKMSKEVRALMLSFTENMTTKDIHFFTMMYDRETRTILAERARSITLVMLQELENYPRFSPRRSTMSACGTFYM
jgi:hypothetical protein